MTENIFDFKNHKKKKKPDWIQYSDWNIQYWKHITKNIYKLTLILNLLKKNCKRAK